MPTPESKLLAAIVKRLRELKAAGHQVWWLKLRGAVYQKAGVPDLLIVYRGKVLFVECKAQGKLPTRLQQATIDAIWAAGVPAIVAWDGSEVDVWIRDVDDEISDRQRLPLLDASRS